MYNYTKEEKVKNRKEGELSEMKLEKGQNIDQIFRRTYKEIHSILTLVIGQDFSKPDF